MPVNPQSPAFPAAMGSADKGITLRQYYASMALQGLVAHGIEVRSDKVMTDEDKQNVLAGRAFRMADAMIRFEAAEAAAETVAPA